MFNLTFVRYEKVLRTISENIWKKVNHRYVKFPRKHACLGNISLKHRVVFKMASVAHGHGGAAARERVLVLGGGAAREPDDLVLARRPARPAAPGRTAAVPRPGHGAAFGFASILLSCGARRRGRDTRRGWRKVRGPSHLLCPAPCA